MGGLNDADGKPLFPKAKILVAQEEGNYWLSQTVADGAPKEVQPFFKMARDSAAPYLSSGQWSSFTPVSYTHLDVYKRQFKYFP